MKRMILYDLDGTLVDTLEDILAAANHSLERLGFPSVNAKQIRPCVGLGLRRLIEACFKTDDERKVEEAMRIYRDYYGEHLLDHSRLYPGVAEVLEHFKDRKQAVITNKPSPYSEQILDGLGVSGKFVEVITGDSGYPKKPKPDSVCAIIKRFEVAFEAAMFVGDSPVDVQTGRSAGVMTVAVSQGFADEADLIASAPDALVNDFSELLLNARRLGW